MKPAAFDRLLWHSTAPAPSHPQTRMLEVGDAKLRVRDTGGDRPALVFFCDPPVMVEHYDALIQALDPAFRVIVIELPGFGFSRVGSAEGLSFSRAVSLVETAIGQLQTGPVILCGPCICGFVVIELARRARLDIRAVVLVQTPDVAGMLKWTEGADPQHRLRRPYIGQLLVRLMAKRLISFWFRYATARQTDDTVMAKKALDVVRAGGAYPLASMLQLWGEGIHDGAVDLPALVFWGQQDRSHTHTDRCSSLRAAPRAELIEMEHCGHFPELEDPAGFVHRAKPFFLRHVGEHDDSVAR